MTNFIVRRSAIAVACSLALLAHAYADGGDEKDAATPSRVLNPVRHYDVTAVGANSPANVLAQITESITWARFTAITQKEGATSPGLGAGFGAGGAGSGALGDALTGSSGFGGGGFGPFHFSSPTPSVTTRIVPIPPPQVALNNFTKVVVLPDETSVQVDVPPDQPGGGGGGTTVVVNVPPAPRPPGRGRPGRPWPGGGGSGGC